MYFDYNIYYFSIIKKGYDWLLTDPEFSPSELVYKNNLEWIFYEQPPERNYTMPLLRTEIRIALNYISKFDVKAKEMLNDLKMYILDGARKFNEAMELSNTLTPKVFKSFPRIGVELSCPKNNWSHYPYEEQYHRYGERWSENGV